MVSVVGGSFGPNNLYAHVYKFYPGKLKSENCHLRAQRLLSHHKSKPTMADSNPPPPPTPHDTTHASIADVHHGDAPVPVHMRYEAQDGSSLFHSGDKPSAPDEATPAHQAKTSVAPPSVPPNPYKKQKPNAPSDADTPSASSASVSTNTKPSSKKRRGKKTPSTSSSQKSRPTPASTTINRNECLTNGFHKWSRDELYALSSEIASSDKLFDEYEDNFSTQINHRFKQENKSPAKFLAAMDSNPRTRSGAVSVSAATPVFNEHIADSTDVRRLSRLHWEDVINSRCSVHFNNVF